MLNVDWHEFWSFLAFMVAVFVVVMGSLALLFWLLKPVWAFGIWVTLFITGTALLKALR
jgi:hypothetical protein